MRYLNCKLIPDCPEALELIEDSSATMTINDVGNGWQHHWFVGRNHFLDMDLKLNVEFTFFHPILKEDCWVEFLLFRWSQPHSVQKNEETVKEFSFKTFLCDILIVLDSLAYFD